MLYITKDFKNIFYINLKCCFSSFETLVDNDVLLRLGRRKFTHLMDDNLAKQISNNVNIWCISRNPYDRFLSFYLDKFVHCFSLGDNKLWQNQPSQLEMYKYFPKRKIENLNLTIDDLIHAIKHGYYDRHLELQSDVYKHNILNKKINHIKLEDPNFKHKMKEIIGADLPISNETRIYKKNYKLSDGNKCFIKEYYKKDFDIFDY